MRTLTFETREEWAAARRGKVTGTRLKDIIVKRGNGKKIGYYELIAERLSDAPDGEAPMERGARLEEEAIALFENETGKKVNTALRIWTRDDDESIAISPDGDIIGEPAALEIKCLSSARHVEALLTQAVPADYEFQVLQYFIVNDDLKTLYLGFYDPRIMVKPFFFIKVERDQEAVDQYLAYQRDILNEVEDIVNKLSF